jgi:hypothetical protein
MCLTSVVLPDCLGPTMATALNCIASALISASASLCIIIQNYNFGIQFQNCKNIFYDSVVVFAFMEVKIEVIDE